MIPIPQTSDNCMAACWASILEVPLAVVPEYQAIRRGGGSWLNAINVWLSRHHGVIYHEPERWLTTHIVPEGWHLINVGIPDGDRIDGGHAIVGYFGRPVWDPARGLPRRDLRIDTWGILVELTDALRDQWEPLWGTCLCGACIRGESYSTFTELGGAHEVDEIPARGPVVREAAADSRAKSRPAPDAAGNGRRP